MILALLIANHYILPILIVAVLIAQTTTLAHVLLAVGLLAWLGATVWRDVRN